MIKITIYYTGSCFDNYPSYFWNLDLHACTHIGAELWDTETEDYFTIDTELPNIHQTNSRYCTNEFIDVVAYNEPRPDIEFLDENQFNTAFTATVHYDGPKTLESFKRHHLKEFPKNSYNLFTNNCADTVDEIRKFFFKDKMKPIKSCYTIYQMLCCAPCLATCCLACCFPVPPGFNSPRGVYLQFVSLAKKQKRQAKKCAGAAKEETEVSGEKKEAAKKPKKNTSSILTALPETGKATDKRASIILEDGKATLSRKMVGIVHELDRADPCPFPPAAGWGAIGRTPRDVKTSMPPEEACSFSCTGAGLGKTAS